MSVTYLNETPLVLLPKNHHHERRQNRTSHQTSASKLPRLLSFPGPRIDSHHQEYDIQRAQDIEDLQNEVPIAVYLKQIQIASYEDKTVEGLRD